MRAAWLITGKDLRLRVRDRSAFVVGIVTPLALAFILNLVFGSTFAGGTVTTLAFADEDGGEPAAGLAEVLAGLEEEGVVAHEELTDGEAVQDAVEEGQFQAGIVIPAGFSESVLAGDGSRLEVIGAVDSPTVVAIAESIARSYATRVEDGQRAAAAYLSGAFGQPDPAQVSAVAEAGAAADPIVTVGRLEAADRVLEPPTFFSAGMAVFFLFFLVQFGVTGLIDEERDGTLSRLQAAPIPRWAILVGKAMTSFLLGMVALSVVAVASTFLMDADWGNPVGLLVLFAAVTLASTSLLGIVGALARTPEGAGNLVAVIAVGLGMLGGTFFPAGSGNRALELASLATPHAWFLRGIGDLTSGGGTLTVIPVLALLGFAVVAGGGAAILAARRYRA